MLVILLDEWVVSTVGKSIVFYYDNSIEMGLRSFHGEQEGMAGMGWNGENGMEWRERDNNRCY